MHDVFSNKVVGWATDPRADTDLVLTASTMPCAPVMSTMDSWSITATRAEQYTALRFTQRLYDAGIAPSTGSVGDSFDNAFAVNLWSTIKVELLYWAGTQFATRTDAEAALLRYIDAWYDPRRIQQGLGALSPDEYEEARHRNNDPATIHTEPDPSR